MKYLILWFSLLAGLPLTAQQPCASDLFYKIVQYPGTGYISTKSAIDTNGDAYVTGGEFLSKFNSSGQPLWTRKPVGNMGFGCSTMFGSRDGNLLYFGETNTSDGKTAQVISKIDPNGNLLWTKSYLPNQFHVFQLYSAVEDSDGSLYAVYCTMENGLSFQDAIVLVKFSATGDMLYSKMHRPMGVRVMLPFDLTIKGDFVYTCGYEIFGNGLRGIVVKLNKEDGSLVWTKEYAFNGGSAIFTRIIPLNDDRFCLLGADDVNSTDTTIVTVINTDGNVLASRFIELPYVSIPQFAVPLDDGTILIGHWLDRFQRMPALVMIHPVNGVLWARKFTGNPIFTPTGMQVDQANRVWLAGTNESGRSSFVLRMLASGTSFCPNTAETIRQQQLPVTTVPVVFESVDHPQLSVDIPINLQAASAPEINTLCGDIPCTSLDLNGPAELCGMGDTLKLQFSTNTGCTTKPDFIFDQAMWKWVDWENDLAVFIPLKPGTSTIEAFIQTSCARLSKAIEVSAGIGEAPALVADTVLCPGSTIRLSLPEGYRSYRWPDGSTATSWQVSQPGDYVVTVTGGCNSVFSLPLKVRASTLAPLDLGKDTIACGVNAFRLDAGNGYASYNWNNGATSSNIVVSQSGTYSVSAATQDGCVTTDEINVRFEPDPADFLPSAADLCNGGILELQPVHNFTSYEWSDGSGSNSITVREAGIYWLSVRDEWNCIGRDSISIQGIECGEWLMVPTAFTPNSDSRNDRFRPVSKGRLVEYEFSVFNRFGQVVFHSTTPGEGWDGTIHGRMQVSNNFSWVCRYRFHNGSAQYKKGRVVLVR